MSQINLKLGDLDKIVLIQMLYLGPVSALNLHHNVEKITPLTISNLYTTLKRLGKKNYIGIYPKELGEKSIYDVTPLGKETINQIMDLLTLQYRLISND